MYKQTKKKEKKKKKKKKTQVLGCKAVQVSHKLRKMILPFALALQKLHLKYCIWFWIRCTKRLMNWSKSKGGITTWGGSWNM